jgi:predicted phage baseplate assembly protein
MSLPSPNLDDRKFQDLVDDTKRQIGRRCPEWTDHNVSDPGVTLVELFAWMTETMLYRLNQVPEKNYVKFLEMVGVSLEPPAPAQTDLRFHLSRYIEDRDGEEAFEQTLRARETVAATTRTESQEAIEFSTDADIRMVRPRLTHVLAIPAIEMGVPGDGRNARDFFPGRDPFRIYGPVPQDGDALYFGFEADVSGNIVELLADSVQSAATGLDEDYPSQFWEFWNGAEDRWDPLEVIRDTSYGFNRPYGTRFNDELTGIIELPLPNRMMSRQIGDKRGYWVRCRYTTDLPPRGVENKRPAFYQKSPEIRTIEARVVGGTAPASNCTTVTFKDLGQSDGTPGQVFSMGQSPILTRRSGETVLVGPQGVARAELEAWTEVTDFSMSGPEDRHFICDSYDGEVIFGPNILQPDGSTRQHGKVPDSGLTITFSAFRHGGGIRGNIAPGQARVLKSSIPYIADVTNPQRADGGREQETIERAKMRGRTVLRQRDRAVTAEDYEYLARQATSSVGRARCVQPRRVHSAGPEGQRIPAGVVRVLLVPALGDAVTTPRPTDLHVPPRIKDDVEKYLDARRLLTAVLEVGAPRYVYVSTDITLVADPKADADVVVRSVRRRLETYLHPLTGGPNGDGWPFRRALTLADIYSQVQAATGVAFLLDAKIYVSDVANAGDNLLTAERLVSNAEGIRIGDDDLLCTREHRIRAVSMDQVGMDDSLDDR